MPFMKTRSRVPLGIGVSHLLRVLRLQALFRRYLLGLSRFLVFQVRCISFSCLGHLVHSRGRCSGIMWIRPLLTSSFPRCLMDLLLSVAQLLNLAAKLTPCQRRVVLVCLCRFLRLCVRELLLFVRLRRARVPSEGRKGPWSR